MFWLHRINRATYALLAGCVAVFSLMLGLFAPQSISLGELVWVLICVPRLHDIGRSGWWVAPPLVGGIALGVVAALTLTGGRAEIAVAVLALVLFGLIGWLGSLKGEAGANRFGAAPPPGFNVQGAGPGQAG